MIVTMCSEFAKCLSFHIMYNRVSVLLHSFSHKVAP